MPNRVIALNVMLTLEEKAALRSSAQKQGFTMSLYVRQLIHAADLMISADVPTCANGRACLIPTVHASTNNNQGIKPS